MTFLVAIPLLVLLVANGLKAASSDEEELAKMFSPILILTEENSNTYDPDEPIRVLKPEPVEIMGAGSAEHHSL